jgi:hypothetical protein
MRYKLFGKSGLRVSELCLGTMTFGEVWQDWGPRHADESRCPTFSVQRQMFSEPHVPAVQRGNRLGRSLSGRAQGSEPLVNQPEERL